MKGKEGAESGGGKWPGPLSPRRTRLPQGGARQNKQEHRELRFYLRSKYFEKAKEEPQMVKPP